MIRFTLTAALAVLVALSTFGAPSPRPADAQSLECSDFVIQIAAQISLRADPSDRNQLDGPDDDGVACSELPCPCDYDPVADAVGDYVPPTATPVPTSPSQVTPASTAVSVSAAATAAAATTVAATPGQGQTQAGAATPLPPLGGATATQGFITPPSTGDAGLLR